MKPTQRQSDQILTGGEVGNSPEKERKELPVSKLKKYVVDGTSHECLQELILPSLLHTQTLSHSL